MAYRRAAILDAGGFDSGFRGWFEDTALAARILERGPIVFAPQAAVVHRAVARRTLSGDDWRTLLRDEQRLADTVPEFYRRTRGPGVVTVAVARWLLGSPLKTLWRDLPRAVADPRGYLALAHLLLGERWSLLITLLSRSWRENEEPGASGAQTRAAVAGKGPGREGNSRPGI
jgi:hypothetical protein